MLKKIRARIEELKARVNQLENLRGPMGDNEAGVVCGTAGQIKEELAFLESLAGEMSLRIAFLNNLIELGPDDAYLEERSERNWLRGGE